MQNTSLDIFTEAFPHLTKWQRVISSVPESNSQQPESRDREADKEFSCYRAGQIRCHAFKMLEEKAALLPTFIHMPFYAWQFFVFLFCLRCFWFWHNRHIFHITLEHFLEKHLELLGALSRAHLNTSWNHELKIFKFE